MMLVSVKSKILLHQVTTNRIAGGDRRRETRAAFSLWTCVLTMTMTGTAPAQLTRQHVKQTTGASNVRHALTSPVSTVIQMCCANMKNYHIFFPPLFLQGRCTSHSKYFSINKQSGRDKSLFISFPHSFQGTDPPCLESFRSTSQMDLEGKNKKRRRGYCHPLFHSQSREHLL